MAKDMIATQSASDLNVYMSIPSGRPKETTFREWVVTNQIGMKSTNAKYRQYFGYRWSIPLTILAMLLALHNLYPSLRPYTQPFFELSYYNTAGDYYVQGWNDIYFILSGALALTAIRAIAIEWILQPMARFAGLKRKGSIRLAEQGWQAMFYGFSWAVGLYIWKDSVYWGDFSAIWTNWPARPLSGLMKWYLLVEISFLMQQIFVIHVEERRKDHYQMLSHHIITSTLLGSAYVYGFYNISNVVLCLMDVVDFLLPSAKILKYLKFENACNVAFGIFLTTWFVTRHIVYNMLWLSIYRNVPEKMPWGCYSGVTAEMISSDGYPDSFAYLFAPFRDLNNPICMNPTIKFIFMGFLLVLQGLSIVWFSMIVRVAYGVVVTGKSQDSRSDDEDDVEVNELVDPQVRLANMDAGANPVVADAPALDRRRSNGSASLRARGRGRVPFDQTDRKALLGRIGCDKPT